MPKLDPAPSAHHISPPGPSSEAYGCPVIWNDLPVMYWGKKAISGTWILGSERWRCNTDIEYMMEFLYARPQENGQPISELIERPELIDGCYRCLWKNRPDQMPTETLGRYGGYANKPDYKPCYHGTKVECLWSIFCRGQLKASANEENGERFVYGAGVYSHTDWKKATTYARWTRFRGNSAWFRVFLELVTDRNDRVVPKKKTDQWITKSLRSTHLFAVWFQIRTDDQMASGEEVAVRLFDERLEALPEWLQAGLLSHCLIFVWVALLASLCASYIQAAIGRKSRHKCQF